MRSDAELRERCGSAPHPELLVDVLQMLPDRASLDDERARDVGVREAVCHTKHHLTLAWRQFGYPLRVEPHCLRQATPESCGAIYRCQVRTDEPHDQPRTWAEVSSAVDGELGLPPAGRVEVDVHVVQKAPFTKVRVEVFP